MSGTQYKSLVGEEDLNAWEGGLDPQTYSRQTSTGATVTMTKTGVSLEHKAEGFKVYASDDSRVALHGMGGV